MDAQIEVIDNRINKRLLTMEYKGIFKEIEAFYLTLKNKYNYDPLLQNNNSIQNNNENQGI